MSGTDTYTLSLDNLSNQDASLHRRLHRRCMGAVPHIVVLPCFQPSCNHNMRRIVVWEELLGVGAAHTACFPGELAPRWHELAVHKLGTSDTPAARHCSSGPAAQLGARTGLQNHPTVAMAAVAALA
jgi:hypothetical protein